MKTVNNSFPLPYLPVNCQSFHLLWKSFSWLYFYLSNKISSLTFFPLPKCQLVVNPIKSISNIPFVSTHTLYIFSYVCASVSSLHSRNKWSSSSFSFVKLTNYLFFFSHSTCSWMFFLLSTLIINHFFCTFTENYLWN